MRRCHSTYHLCKSVSAIPPKSDIVIPTSKNVSKAGNSWVPMVHVSEHLTESSVEILLARKVVRSFVFFQSKV